MNKFYRYIIRRHNGFQIQYKNEHYGWYDNIYDALFDRDRLEECNWDLEEFVWLPEKQNPYKNIQLPPKEVDNYMQYISRNGKKFRITKQINGKQKHFGTYKTLDEAIKKRNELIKNGWCLEDD